MQDKQVFRFES